MQKQLHNRLRPLMPDQLTCTQHKSSEMCHEQSGCGLYTCLCLLAYKHIIDWLYVLALLGMLHTWPLKLLHNIKMHTVCLNVKNCA